MRKNKQHILIIFDVDQTITKKDFFEYLLNAFLTNEESKYIMSQTPTYKNNYVPIQNIFYETINKKGIKIEKIKEILNTVELNEGMKELFSFLEENKKHFESIIISAGNSYNINYLLNKYKIHNLFKEIISNKAYEKKNDLIFVEPCDLNHGCDKCNPCQCKTYELNKFLKINPKENYDKIIFIGDGSGDCCLAAFLSENDWVLPRKNLVLYDSIIKGNLKNIIRSKVLPWENAFEIIKFLKNIL